MAKRDDMLKTAKKMKREELVKRVNDLKLDLARLRVKVATGKHKNYSKLKKSRKEIARYMTVLNQLDKKSK